MKNNDSKKNKNEQQKPRVIGVPRGSRSDTNFIVFEECGDSLTDFGICKGDSIIVKPIEKLDENRITVWETPDGRTAKFAYENFGDITLYNKKDWLMRYPAKKVKLIGAVVAVQKNLEVAQ